jgi:hypothetical protein
MASVEFMQSVRGAIDKQQLTGKEIFLVKFTKEGIVDLRDTVDAVDTYLDGCLSEDDGEGCIGAFFRVDGRLRSVKYALLGRTDVHEVYTTVEGTRFADDRFHPLTRFEVHGSGTREYESATLALYKALFRHNDDAELRRMMRDDDDVCYSWRLHVLALRLMLVTQVHVESKVLTAILVSVMISSECPDVVKSLDVNLNTDMADATFEPKQLVAYKLFRKLLVSIQDLGILLGLEQGAQWLDLSGFPSASTSYNLFMCVLDHLVHEGAIDVVEDDFVKLLAVTGDEEEVEDVACTLYESFLRLRDAVLHDVLC